MSSRFRLAPLPGLLAALALSASFAAFDEAPAEACTTFCLASEDAVLVGKSYDWHMGQGMVMVNKRGVEKTALVLSGTPASWTSKHASLTFNQYGRELPNGGINEAGLVIEIMWLTGSEYPKADKRKTLNELQWIQYHLDRFDTVAEVVKSSKSLRVAPVAAEVHYMACDVTSACATFEYLDGSLAITTGKELVQPVLTNDSYPSSAAHLRKHKGFGGKTRVPKGKGSLDRFVIAARAVTSSPKKNDKKAAIAHAFEGLTAVRNGSYSKWNIVYDLKEREVHFRSHGHKSIKRVDLDDFDPSCTTPVQVLDLNNDLEGNIRDSFADYSDDANAKLVKQSLANTPGVPALAKALVARYPRATTCSAKSERPGSRSSRTSN